MSTGSGTARRGPVEGSAAAASRASFPLTRAGRREASRRRVETIALRLFARHGFDDVTVEQVCAEAEIAPATFYRYFGSKEGVVFSYEQGFLAAASELGLPVDPDQPTVEQLRAVLRRCSRFLEEQREVLALRDDIVLANAALLQRTFAVQRRFEATLASALALHRHEAEPSTGTLLDAALCVVVLRVALRSWRSHSDSSLQVHADDTYEFLRTRLTGPAGGDVARS
jgi:AcrR family transcriptional regulator